MTHEERRKRRERIAKAVKKGDAKSKIAQKYSVGMTTIRNAMREFGVGRPEGSQEIPSSSFEILRRLLDGERQVGIAKDLKVSRQRVHAIAVRAREAGFSLPA